MLAAAAAGPVLPVYVLDDETPGEWAIGAAQRWWLHRSLASLGAELARLGAPLLLRRGRAGRVVPELAAAVGAETVHALRHYEPWWRQAEAEVDADAKLHLYDGQFLAPPPSVTGKTGARYRIFTPFWNALKTQMPPLPPLPAPERLTPVPNAPAGDALDDWHLLPTRPDWSGGFGDWRPGEAGAHAALAAFVARAEAYAHGRNLPGTEGSSRLSPFLHHGEISAATAWHAVSDAAGADAAEPYLRELGFRDFATGLIDQFPDYATRPSRAQFDRFPHLDIGGADGSLTFIAWARGRTGYPIVDAGLRQLWATGWMHNRVRMIASSFAVKHLLIDWRDGERWFWDTLVDADLGNNAFGWQWIMGSGVDSSPFNRVFNPVGQSEKFDANGTYIRRWVPELAALPDAALHAPWTADPATLAAAGVVLGDSYPLPVVDHAYARDRALKAYDAAKA